MPGHGQRGVVARHHKPGCGRSFLCARNIAARSIWPIAIFNQFKKPLRQKGFLVSAEEVTLSCDFNSLQWPTCRNGTIEPQKLFPAVANRKLRLKL